MRATPGAGSWISKRCEQVASFGRGRGTASGARFMGGDRLLRFIRRASDARGVARSAAKSIRLRVLPALRQRVPSITGKLRRSLRVNQRGTGVVLNGNRYAPFVRFLRAGASGRRRSVAVEAHSEMRLQAPAIGRAVNTELGG